MNLDIERKAQTLDLFAESEQLYKENNEKLGYKLERNPLEEDSKIIQLSKRIQILEEELNQKTTI